MKSTGARTARGQSKEVAVIDNETIVREIGRERYLAVVETHMPAALRELLEESAREGARFDELLPHFTARRLELAPEPLRDDVREIIERVARTLVN
jgi:hypothetical protein